MEDQDQGYPRFTPDAVEIAEYDTKEGNIMDLRKPKDTFQLPLERIQEVNSSNDDPIGGLKRTKKDEIIY